MVAYVLPFTIYVAVTLQIVVGGWGGGGGVFFRFKSGGLIGEDVVLQFTFVNVAVIDWLYLFLPFIEKTNTVIPIINIIEHIIPTTTNPIVDCILPRVANPYMHLLQLPLYFYTIKLY